MSSVFIIELTILLVAAFLGGLLVRRFGYPVALGELVIGIAIGPFALGFVRHSEMVEIFAELGAIILLFYIGLETEVNMLKKHLKPSLFVGTLGAVLPLVLGYYSGLLLGFQHGEALFLGTVLTATSLGITVRMLQDLRRLHTPLGMTILGAGVVDDIVAVILLTSVLDLLKEQLDLSNLWMTLLIVVVFWFVVFVIGVRFLSKLFDRVPIRIESLVILLLAVGFGAAFISAEVGMSTIIGAFAAGVSLSGMSRIKSVLEKGHALYLFFVPIFFVSIGMLVDLRLFTINIIPSLLVTAVAIAGKVVGCGGAALLTGSSRKDALRIGVGMSSRGEIGLIIAAIGLASGFISEQVFTISVVSVALSTIIGMPALKLLLKGARR